MSLTFSIDIKGTKDLEKKFVNLLSRVNLSNETIRKEVKETFQTIMFKDLTKRFASSPRTVTGGQVYGGQYWSHLSDYYLQLRPDRAQGVIYIDSGDLQRSLVSMTENTLTELKENGTFSFGTKLPYAEKLQAKRPILILHDDLVTELIEGYEKVLLKEFKDDK
jgi:hypothetical protein